MRWIGTFIGGGRPRSDTDGHQPPAELPDPSGVIEPSANGDLKRLVLLVRDAAGLDAYRLHSFGDAEEAATFVRFWFPPGLEHGVLAFWISHQETESRDELGVEQPSEAVVLIRNESDPGLVRPFSFASMHLAHSWIAKEGANGLNLRLLLVHWATAVRVTWDHHERVNLAPRHPPPARRRNGSSTPVQTLPVDPPAGREDTPDRATVFLEDGPEEPPDVSAELAGPVTPTVEEEQPPDPHHVIRSEDTPDRATVFLENEPEEPPDVSAELATPVTPTVEEEQPPDPHHVIRSDEPDEPAGAVREAAAVAHAALSDNTENETATDESSSDESEEAPSDPEENGKALRWRRWRQQEEPFQGFGSPPGRF